MGNDPANGIDPDGGYSSKFVAGLVAFFTGGERIQGDGGTNNRKWVVLYNGNDLENHDISYGSKPTNGIVNSFEAFPNAMKFLNSKFNVGIDL